MSENHNKQHQTPRRGPMGGGPVGMMVSGQKAKNFKGTMGTFIGYLKPFWISIVVVLAFAVASTVFSIVSPKILGNITTQVVEDYVKMTVYDTVMDKLPQGTTLPAGTTGEQLLEMMKNTPQGQQMISQIPDDKLDIIKEMDFSSRPGIDFDAIAQTVQVLLILYIVSALFSYIQGWIMTGVTQKITYNFRRAISEKINRMPLRYFDTRTHGDVLSRVTNDVDTISQSLNQSMTQIVTSVATLIGILIMMLTISWQMTLVALLVLPLSFGLIAIVVKNSQKYFNGQQETLGSINGHVEEMYSGHNVMKAFNGEEHSIAEFKGYNGELYTSAWKSQFFSGLMMPMMTFISNLGYVGVCVLGGKLAIDGVIKVGDIQAFIQYVRQFHQPVVQSAQIANVLQSTAAAAERVFEFLDEDEETPENTAPIVIENVKGSVEFNDVIFGYNPDRMIIKDFNEAIHPGQRIALVGPTGAGKTTIVNLLMRFYDVNSGSIKVDGIDIRDMKRSDLRRMFGMVLQDTWLFNGTIKENIRYGNQTASDEELYAAAKAAHVDHFVHSLPGGYNMVLNEEASNISQGQKQLLTIARAMLANPPMLILDEATSSVDTRTEILIQKAMDRLMQGRTCFIIAHRLSTIKDADLILVMKDGSIVEQGTHSDLLKLNGFYASLYNSQFTEAIV